ncbi:hypothetical protein [Paracoccus laeviglucosivorans]|uniref:Uncharacterized protein n=1 Tax=Paracoccus laeviglucosivorans TaxID=1197861 RepID=A0A521DSK1_9RHOB|nr:hypothetical protein [Paracoccus laeviglucosivorans]SMO74598.1 hypothetical protein SAMN06265221_109113 [Paracoccus laeviglucosivorans]
MKITTAAMALIIALPATGALATITARSDNPEPRGWSAVAGMDPRAVREMARTLPPSAEAVEDQPWCDMDAEVEASLKQDFDETKIATNGRDTALWGSDLMGTWTVVLERPDQTSCVIASGIGFSGAANPAAYLTKVGLNG